MLWARRKVKNGGRPLYMWDIMQHVIKDGRILEEWMRFNEFEVMKIYRE